MIRPDASPLNKKSRNSTYLIFYCHYCLRLARNRLASRKLSMIKLCHHRLNALKENTDCETLLLNRPLTKNYDRPRPSRYSMLPPTTLILNFYLN